VLKEDGTQKVVRQHRPLGVVAAITAWNVPMILLTIKVAPALLAGNTVVAKPAPTAPLTTLKFGELCARILPPGVVNVIVDQNDLGTALTSHPDVAKVAFTGSTATGKKVIGTEQILGAICERFERATIVALDSIVLFPENALNPEALVLFPATI
jgi:acyl-CoA reductase-like NAD-dependent aldehyde dehydrogenase